MLAIVPAVDERHSCSCVLSDSQALSTDGAVKSIACLVKMESLIVQQGMNKSPGRSRGSSGRRFVVSFNVGMPAARHKSSSSSLILS